MPLTKAHIVKAISRQVSLSKRSSLATVESLLEIIKRALESGDDLLISGFGKFSIKERKERNGRNPVTGENLTITPRKVVTFKCSPKLRERLNSACAEKMPPRMN